MSPHHPPRQSLAALLRSPAAASGSENTGDATGDAAADVTADTVSDAAQARSDTLPAADAGTPATAAPAMATQTETVPLPAADGTPLTADELKGHWTLVFIGFTHCPDVCPTTLGEIGIWQEELGDTAKDLRFWFVTVDPERDSVVTTHESVNDTQTMAA